MSPPVPRKPVVALLTFYWLPLAAWVVFALLLSTTVGSYDHSFSAVYAVLTFLVPEAPAPPVNTIYGIVHIFRRSATIFLYIGMALLSFRAMQGGEPRLKRRGVATVLALGAFIAGADNAVRSRSPLRHGGWDDFAFETGSIALTTLGIVLFFAAKQWERDRFAAPAANKEAVQ